MKTLSIALSLAASLALTGCCNSDAPSEPARPDTGSKNQAATSKSAADLDPAKATEKAPDVFKAKFSTTKGDFTVEVHREWSPNGADRFYNLVKMGFFDDVRFFRVVDGFMAQVGLHGDPTVNAKWRRANIPDDPVKQSNKRGFLSFAMGGPGSRTTQFFINFIDNTRLDGMGFAPFAQVVDGMNIVDSLNKEYGEGAPQGKGPDQGRIQMQGNAYLDADFPRLDKIKSARIQ